jgi:pilus assembly protein CpaC
MFALSVCASAQDKTTIQASFSNTQPIKIDVLVGQSRLIEFDEDYERLSISDPKIAEVVPISYRQALVNGLTFGQVNLVAWAKRPKGTPDRMAVFDIYVQVNLSLIDNQIKILFPKENIQLSQANNSVVISGSVTRPELAEQVQKIIEAAGLKVTNLLKAPVLDAAQVQLQIRVAEVNRQILREVATAYGIGNRTVPAYISSGGPSQVTEDTGIDIVSTGVKAAIAATTGVNVLLGQPNASVLGFIRALHSRGAIRELAEPNLIAMHGQKASFLAGGEFPIPIIQSLNSGQTSVTIYFKEFGIKLNFTPTIIDENHIRLELEPEVSTPDYTFGIVLQGFQIPGLSTRRAKTSLELRDGQSFALAGLIDNREQVNLSKVPLLGDIPMLGELFKSRRFQRNETELMFLATVKIVEPLNPDQIPRLPGVSDLKPVGSTNPTGTAPSSSVEGQSGHSVPAVPRKSGDGAPESGNKTQIEQPDSSKVKVESAALPNLTTAVVGPVGTDPGAQKTAATSSSKPETKPEVKEQKTPPPSSDKPEKQ